MIHYFAYRCQSLANRNWVTLQKLNSNSNCYPSNRWMQRPKSSKLVIQLASFMQIRGRFFLCFFSSMVKGGWSFVCSRCLSDRLFHIHGVLRHSDLLPRSGTGPVPRRWGHDPHRPTGTHHERCRFRHHGRRPPHRYLLHHHHRLDFVLLCGYFYRLTRFTMGRLQYLTPFYFACSIHFFSCYQSNCNCHYFLFFIVTIIIFILWRVR